MSDDFSVPLLLPTPYVDREGDRVVLSSDEELQALYRELGANARGDNMGVIKMRVVVLERREEQGAGTNGVGKKEVEVPHQLDEVTLGGPPCQAWTPRNIAASRDDQASESDQPPPLVTVSLKEKGRRSEKKNKTSSQQTTQPHQSLQRALTSSSSDYHDGPPPFVSASDGRSPVLNRKYFASIAVLESTPAVARTSTPITIDNNTSTTSAPAPPPPTPSLLADLTEAFTLFATSPAFTNILDRVAQGYYTSPSVEQAAVIVENGKVEPVASKANSEEPKEPIVVDTSASAAISSNLKDRGPSSIVESVQTEVIKVMGEAKRGVEDAAGSIFGTMASALTSGVKEVLALRQTRDAKERDSRDAAAAEVEKKEEVVVVKNGPVVAATDSKEGSPTAAAFSMSEETKKFLALVGSKEEPAKFGQQSVVGRGGLPAPLTPPGRGFARFYGGTPNSQQPSFSPSYKDSGSFLTSRDGQKVEEKERAQVLIEASWF